MNLPNRLREKRDELLESLLERSSGSGHDQGHIDFGFEQGFNACAEILLPQLKEFEGVLEVYSKEPKSNGAAYSKACQNWDMETLRWKPICDMGNKAREVLEKWRILNEQV